MGSPPLDEITICLFSFCPFFQGSFLFFQNCYYHLKPRRHIFSYYFTIICYQTEKLNFSFFIQESRRRSMSVPDAPDFSRLLRSYSKPTGTQNIYLFFFLFYLRDKWGRGVIDNYINPPPVSFFIALNILFLV